MLLENSVIDYLDSTSEVPTELHDQLLSAIYDIELDFAIGFEYFSEKPKDLAKIQNQYNKLVDYAEDLCQLLLELFESKPIESREFEDIVETYDIILNY
ncbi:hypothetical protein CL176_05715 [Suicoccus acidiformans]|uniref:Uncharacterized protein n=1 Tax=Suicoccus acidiformans TaxID=2036206 RepID=A0A347WKC2_9LACT|nr:hypothetical protein [Suicoccus acidiformans]AXY25529.1 hypothetical protein CL176_05715 [Suicoccus acidiformans]